MSNTDRHRVAMRRAPASPPASEALETGSAAYGCSLGSGLRLRFASDAERDAYHAEQDRLERIRRRDDEARERSQRASEREFERRLFGA